MPTIPFESWNPTIDQTAWIAPDAWVIGQATVGPQASIFFHAVLRGDILPITVGPGTNIQEGALLHTSHGLSPCTVGSRTTIGHHAIIHGCTVSDLCIIGMGCTILDGAVVGKNCIVGANSLIPMNMTIPDGSMVYGSPAKIVRPLTDKEILSIAESADRYQEVMAIYRSAF